MKKKPSLILIITIIAKVTEMLTKHILAAIFYILKGISGASSDSGNIFLIKIPSQNLIPLEYLNRIMLHLKVVIG